MYTSFRSGKGSGCSEDDRRQRLVEDVFGAELAKDLKMGEDKLSLMQAPCSAPVPPGRLRARRE